MPNKLYNFHNKVFLLLQNSQKCLALTLLICLISLFSISQRSNELNKKPKISIDTYDIDVLQTDQFENMFPMSDSLKEIIYHDKNVEAYIYSYLSESNHYLSLITYLKNFEAENYRVDYIDLVNISAGKLLDKITLAVKDDEVITYETISYLSGDSLTVIEKLSTEDYDGMDTLFTTRCFINLSEIRIDTLDISTNFSIRK